ncbi:hypothetical protein FAES_5406 [Fibrella aestuarina BUZ 2]|uniref:Lipoprotein n=1 Tax=Fibrella aestuarina BUZ 2 TaxID=1166018 RepID=I0KH02_9BACT|nr:hypothetical protein [Fibrella aestuarina]CCH03405.1 hypothetical protein FAES_5406 [Fibrella aestuarina BUZ 2]
MKTIATLLLLTICLGCATTRFNTNTDRGTLPEFSRILVVSKVPLQKRDYIFQYLTAFPIEYEVCAIEASVLAFGNPDSLVREKIKQCDSQVMLTIQPYNDFVSGTGKYATGYSEFLVEMTDLATNKPFWKSIAVTAGGSWPNVGETVRQLRRDGVITGSLRAADVMTPASR